jgi:hypothetical protein
MESSNYELYMKYTKLIEEQLEAFLKSLQGIKASSVLQEARQKKSSKVGSWVLVKK